MAENRPISQARRECERGLVCIDTYRVLDSCRDRDCFEDVRVYLTEFGQEIIEKTTVARVKNAQVIHAYIDVESVPFNRGFYQLSIRIYTKLECEACLGAGRSEEFDGLAVVEKKVVLFGSEGGVSIFKSDPCESTFCPGTKPKCCGTTNAPVAALETVDPIVLDCRIVDRSGCRHCTCVDELPDCVADRFAGALVECPTSPHLAVSLGFFTVIRLERPAQYLVSATEYNVPNKECVQAESDDPCSVFRRMSFPVEEFSTPSIGSFTDCPRPERGDRDDGGCPCRD